LIYVHAATHGTDDSHPVTILRRMGYHDDPSLFNTLTEAEVLSWWNAGVGTVANDPPGVRPRQAGRSTPYSSFRQ
jgi:hypothetical protein